MKLYRYLTALALGLCAVSSLLGRDVQIVSEPSGATIRLLNPLDDARRFDNESMRWTAPAVIDFPRRSEPFQLEVSLADYETRVITYDYNNDRDRERIGVSLERLREDRYFSFTSDPAGATVLVNGRNIGTTPLRAPLEFSRSDSSSPWSRLTVSFSRNGYQSEQVTLDRGSFENVPTVRLARVDNTKMIGIVAKTPDGSALVADVEINGQVVGQTPYTAELAFTRADRNAAWNTYQVRVFLEDVYQPESATITYETVDDVELVLEPVTELPVTRFFPSVIQTPRGPARGMDLSAPIGTLDVRDISSPATDIRPVTNFQRDQQILQAVNSFCLTPDGQSVIYSVTMKDLDGGKGDYYANLFLKGATDQSMAFSQLTRGTRFFDTNPVMSYEEGSNLLVFQSNRGPLESWDVSSFRLRDGRVIGGIQQLTRDSRLNYNPALTSEAQPVYFSSSETFPGAVPFISLVRVDGSSYTNLGETGTQLYRAQNGQIYFVRKAEDTQKSQIYSVSDEGLQFSAVMNDPEFGQANCTHPAISPDGTKLLFVSDYHQDEEGRNNNNLYVYDLTTARIQQLTDNGSDDTKPAWSPTEPGVIYFLSNRGGVYNIWRMTIVNFE